MYYGYWTQCRNYFLKIAIAGIKKKKGGDSVKVYWFSHLLILFKDKIIW